MRLLRLIATRLWRRPGLRLAVCLLCGLLLVLEAAAVGFALRHEYRAAVDDILGESDRTAQKLAGRTGEVFDRANQTTLLVRYLRASGQLPPLQDMRGGGVLANDVTRLVLTANERGSVDDSTSALFAMNIGDEDDFKAHKRRADLDVTVSKAAPNPLAGGWALSVMRRLDDVRGDFAGVVMATVDPAALTERFAKGELSNTAIGVVGLDGVYRSRLLHGKVTFGERIDVVKLEERAATVKATHLPIVSPIDGIARFVATARVPGYPFIAVVAVDAGTALEGYRHFRANLLAWAGSSAALVLAAAALLLSRVKALQYSQQQTRQVESVLRATLEGSIDSVCILRALRSETGELIDMRVTDCNSRAARMVGRRREDVVGQRLCELAPSIRTGGFLRRFEEVMRTGTAQDAEVKATDASVADIWLHHQLVPLDGGLALISRDVTERRATHLELASQAHVDTLTRLGNRRDFERRLKEAHARALRSGQTLALVYADLDGFKAVNDSWGHAVGDELLVGVAGRLTACVRTTDAVNRLGGDEFTVILENAGTPAEIAELCGRIVGQLSRPYLLSAGAIVATPSLGVALLLPGEPTDVLQIRADQAMYRAKKAGKGRFCFSAQEPAPAPAEPVQER